MDYTSILSIVTGAENIFSLNLAGNFLFEFPAAALKICKELKYLNLSSNLIQVRYFLVLYI